MRTLFIILIVISANAAHANDKTDPARRHSAAVSRRSREAVLLLGGITVEASMTRKGYATI